MRIVSEAHDSSTDILLGNSNISLVIRTQMIQQLS